MKGRVLLAHVFFDILGGGEFLALNIAKALREEGFDVTIYTCTPLDPDAIRKMFNIDVNEFNVVVKPVRQVDVLRKFAKGRLVRLRRLMAYRRFFSEYMDLGREYDLVMDTQSNLVSPADISYIHYPCLGGFYEGEGRGLLWKIYDRAVKLYAGRFKHSVPGRVFTNSLWTAMHIYRIHHVVADVVYPPVDVEYFSRVSDNDKREKMVVTVSRFTAEKGLDKIVDVASKLRDYTFVLIGTTDEYSHIVLGEIERKVGEYRLDNVVVEPDLPRSKMLEYMRDARYYLHPEFTEHFGIAVVEAMAAGLVPMVYRDGGAWHDIASRVWDLLGYRSIEEVPILVRRIDSDSELYDWLRKRSIEVSRMFTYEHFKRSLLEKVGYVLKVKRIALAHTGS